MYMFSCPWRVLRLSEPAAPDSARRSGPYNHQLREGKLQSKGDGRTDGRASEGRGGNLAGLLLVLPPVPDLTDGRSSPSLRSLDSAGPRPGQPAWGRLHQRATPPQPHPPQDRGNGAPRDPALRHIQAVARLPRLCLEDPVPVPRDGLDPPRRHRGEQTQGEWTRAGRQATTPGDPEAGGG